MTRFRTVKQGKILPFRAFPGSCGDFATVRSHSRRVSPLSGRTEALQNKAGAAGPKTVAAETGFAIVFRVLDRPWEDVPTGSASIAGATRRGPEMTFCIASAADRNYHHCLTGLLDSLAPIKPTLAVIDLGLTAEQRG